MVPNLSIRQRPKCLVIHASSHSKYENDETEITDSLTYAWKKKFIDFSTMTTNETTKVIYHYNPFNDTVFRKKLPVEEIQVFPDKLRNAFGYPFFIKKTTSSFRSYWERRGPKLHMHARVMFEIIFTAKMLNLKPYVLDAPDNDSWISLDYFKKWNLDVCPKKMVNINYSRHYVISADKSLENIVTFVPMIPIARMDVYFKFLCNFFIIFLIILPILCFLKYFKFAIGRIRIFDVVRLLLGQSVHIEPQKIAHIIVYLTVILTFFMITNDVLKNVMSTIYYQEEVPFDTHEQLYDSGLQIYADIVWFKYFFNTSNPYLRKILNKILFINDISSCLSTLKKWKNVSCVAPLPDPELMILKYQNSDGSPTMKIAEPPLVSAVMQFYWFVDNSPFAMKILKVQRRVKETRLMHWPLLVDNNSEIDNIDVLTRTINDKIKLEQLLTVLSFNFSISVVVFIIEFITFRVSEEFKKRN